MKITHKITLNPNNKQCTYFKKASGVARFTWNWALAEWKNQYQLSLQDTSIPKPNGFALKKAFNAIKKTEFPWMYEVTKYASQQPFIHLQKACKDFFTGKSRAPRFKKKGRARDSFYIGGDQIQIEKNRIRIPNLGWVRMRESLKYGGKIEGVTISRQADKWFASIHCDVDICMLSCKNQAVVGVDVGINRLATLSTGELIENNRPFQKMIRRLRRYQRQLSTQKNRGSKNYEKLRQKIARLHQKVADKRHDTQHQLSRKLTKQFHAIVIEDLNVSGMLKNHKLARHIADVGFYELRRQLEYKSQWYGNTLIVADRWFPSSKRCSRCGETKSSLELSERIFQCETCESSIDRDLNAAINLQLLSTGSSPGIYALGQDGSAICH